MTRQISDQILYGGQTLSRKPRLLLLTVSFLVAACSGQASPASFVTQSPTLTPEVIRPTPTLKIVDPTPASTSVPATMTQIPPTQTPVPVDLEKLPKLSEVIISWADSETIDEFVYNPLILVTDATSEVQDSCLWDCAKYRYSLEEGTLTILLLRAGDPQKAESTLGNLRKDFLRTVGFEYTADDIPWMSPKSWALVDAASAKDSRTGAAGSTHGSIVVLVTYSQIFCEYDPVFGRYCEGSIMPLAGTSLYFVDIQVEKLKAAGYPE